MTGASWFRLENDIVSCERCPRLRRHCETVALRKRRAFRDGVYWGRPVPGFGDREARVLLVGLAPAAHGANRTGRMFTGDRSGDWLYAALHRVGLATAPRSLCRGDELQLNRTWITAVCRCAPPDNRPLPAEMERCAPFLDREIDLLGELRVVVALGKIAWDALGRRAVRVASAAVPRPRTPFGHGARTMLPLRHGRPALTVLGCYHPSQQNTSTGRLTRRMLGAVLRRAAAIGRADAASAHGTGATDDPR